MLSLGIFTYSTRPRGSVVHATHLAEALTARGHEVTLYALSKAGDRLYRELSCPVVLLAAEKAPEDPDELIRQRVGEMVSGLLARRPRHDVYHAEDCLAASGLLDASATLGLRPIVRTLHHLERFESPYLLACQRRSVLAADATLCVSRLSQRDVERELGRLCPIIGNGVDTARFDRCSLVKEAELRQRLRVPAGAPVVLSVGGVEPRKNSLRALSAMTEVLARLPSVYWLIAGGCSIWEHDSYRRDFRGRLASLTPELQGRIRELGPLEEDELTALYGTSAVLLCPSLQEGFGLCALEALASRTALVVSEAEPFTEYLDSSVASFVAPDSSGDIAAAVAMLLADRELYRTRIERGAELAREFSWERVAVEHERFYLRLAGATEARRARADQEPIHA